MLGCNIRNGLFAIMMFAQGAAGAAGIEDEAQAMLDAAFPDDGPGAVAVVSRNGEVIFEGAAGMADLELGVPMETGHIFRLASVTKHYTAAAILKLAAEGRLSLDDPLSRFLPDFPVGEVTVEQLLNHTSGIRSYTSIEGYMSDGRVRRDVTTAELIEVFADEPVDFAPGEKYAYNNSGYVLLGAIIEKVTGGDWNAYIEQELLAPLGLERTGYYPDSEIVTGRVPGYQADGEDWDNAPYLSMTQPHAAGALSATAAEVDRWQRALHGGEVIPADPYARMISPVTVTTGVVGDHDYGYGLIAGQFHDEKVIHHGGGINGFNTHVLWLPEKKLSVVTLANSVGGASAQDMALKLATLATGRTLPSATEPVAWSDDQYAQVIGTYRIDEETTRMLYRDEDGKLVSQRQGSRTFEVHPVAGDRIAFKDSLSWFAIERDDAGKVVAVALHNGWGGEPERAEKISDEVEQRASVDLPAAHLERLAGVYELMPGFRLTVRVVDGGLEIQGTGQPAIPVAAESETRFYSKEVGADIEFELPESGPATKLTLYQGGQVMPGPRVEAGDASPEG